MTFLNFDDIEPVLQEYDCHVAVKMLLDKHEEFDQKLVTELMASLRMLSPMLRESDSKYSAYVTSVVTCRQAQKLANSI